MFEVKLAAGWQRGTCTVDESGDVKRIIRRKLAKHGEHEEQRLLAGERTAGLLSLLQRVALAVARVVRAEALGDQELERLSEQLAGTALYTESPQRIAEVHARHAQIDEELMVLLERWEALSAPAR